LAVNLYPERALEGRLVSRESLRTIQHCLCQCHCRQGCGNPQLPTIEQFGSAARNRSTASAEIRWRPDEPSAGCGSQPPIRRVSKFLRRINCISPTSDTLVSCKSSVRSSVNRANGIMPASDRSVFSQFRCWSAWEHVSDRKSLSSKSVSATCKDQRPGRRCKQCLTSGVKAPEFTVTPEICEKNSGHLHHKPRNSRSYSGG